jgi:hypothetical protein
MDCKHCIAKKKIMVIPVSDLRSKGRDFLSTQKYWEARGYKVDFQEEDDKC